MKEEAFPCPKCGSQCEREYVDIGVGIMPCSPWGCPFCHWFEEVPELDLDEGFFSG